MENKMSIFTSDSVVETLVKAVIVRVEPMDKGNYRLLCMLGNEKAPIVVVVSKPFMRDGDYIELRKTTFTNKDGKILEQLYELEKNVSLIDACKDSKEELLNILGQA